MLIAYISKNAGFNKSVDILGAGMTVRNILLCVIGGFGLALIIMYYCKMIAGKGVALLMKADAFSPEKAKSLSELGIKNVRLHTYYLEKCSPQKVICMKIGTEPARYYIAEEQKTRAERTYTSKENALGMTVVSLILTAILFFGVYFWSDSVIEKANLLINSIKQSSEQSEMTPDGGYLSDETEEIDETEETEEIGETSDEETDEE